MWTLWFVVCSFKDWCSEFSFWICLCRIWKYKGHRVRVSMSFACLLVLFGVLWSSFFCGNLAAGTIVTSLANWTWEWRLSKATLCNGVIGFRFVPTTKIRTSSEGLNGLSSVWIAETTFPTFVLVLCLYLLACENNTTMLHARSLNLSFLLQQWGVEWAF